MPSLSVPSTQNTAPVLDFRCLYTFDLRRKAKRWQDGLARFHTFNKRVMVYDEPRNFIGDTHWREPEPIQEGDELRLDKGVLIQVGEPTAKTDQDISGLFEKRRSKEAVGGGSSPTRGTVTQHVPEDSVRPTAAVPSQLRPRTLNSLLGTPRGRIGRATLPTKSPYEERKANNVEVGIKEPAAKRQRIMTTHESHAIPSRDPSIRPSPPRSAPVKPQESRPPRSVEQRPAGVPGDAAQLIRPEIAVGTVEREHSHRRQPKEKRRRHRDNVEPDNGSKSLTGPTAQPPRPQKLPESASRKSPDVIIIDRSGKPEARKDPAPRGARLRIASSKPRQKLMYKDLLPSAPESIKLAQGNKVQLENPSSLRRNSSNSNETASQTEPLSQFHREQRNRLRQRLKKHSREQSGSVHDLDSNSARDPGALFLSEDELPAPLPDDDAVAGENSTETSKGNSNHHDLHAQTFSPTVNRTPQNAQMTVSDELARLDSLLQRHPLNPPKPSLSNKNTQKKSLQLNPPPPCIQPPNPKPPRIPEKLAQSPPKPKQKPKPLQRSLSAVITSASTTAIDTSNNKRPLRKTISDTGPQCRQNSREEAAPVVVVPDPWSEEAWELFGCRRTDFGVVKCM
ncbi:MAG: hypothetical protein Q9191_007439 [Dirinaria sp. TL-2023a]